MNKRAHWHVIFSARTGPEEGVSCRSIHRTLYGFYGTDIRTCIERTKDCERDGFVRIVDASNRPCTACSGTIAALRAAFGGLDRLHSPIIRYDREAVAAIFNFLSAYDQKWRETSEFVVRQKRLTPAHVNDAMDHLVTYQYWAIIMLLWWASPFGSDEAGASALVIDEINSRMWDALRLGHLAIKERVDNLIRWGFFAEQTIKRHKAVALTPVAGSAISKSLSEAKPLLEDLHARLVSQTAEVIPARSA